MLQNVSVSDGMLAVCLVVGLVLWGSLANAIRAYRRELIAEKLIASAINQLRAGGMRTRVLSGLAYMAEEAGVTKEVDELWPLLYRQD